MKDDAKGPEHTKVAFESGGLSSSELYELPITMMISHTFSESRGTFFADESRAAFIAGESRGAFLTDESRGAFIAGESQGAFLADESRGTFLAGECGRRSGATVGTL